LVFRLPAGDTLQIKNIQYDRRDKTSPPKKTTLSLFSNHFTTNVAAKVGNGGITTCGAGARQNAWLPLKNVL